MAERLQNVWPYQSLPAKGRKGRVVITCDHMMEMLNRVGPECWHVGSARPVITDPEYTDATDAVDTADGPSLFRVQVGDRVASMPAATFMGLVRAQPEYGWVPADAVLVATRRDEDRLVVLVDFRSESAEPQP